MANSDYRMCVRCVMDSDEPGIYFSATGECNYCTEGLKKVREGLLPLQERERALQALVRKMKEEGRGNRTIA